MYIAIYGVPWIPSIYPSHVSIYYIYIYTYYTLYIYTIYIYIYTIYILYTCYIPYMDPSWALKLKWTLPFFTTKNRSILRVSGGFWQAHGPAADWRSLDIGRIPRPPQWLSGNRWTDADLQKRTTGAVPLRMWNGWCWKTLWKPIYLPSTKPTLSLLLKPVLVTNWGTFCPSHVGTFVSELHYIWNKLK